MYNIPETSFQIPPSLIHWQVTSMTSGWIRSVSEYMTKYELLFAVPPLPTHLSPGWRLSAVVYGPASSSPWLSSPPPLHGACWSLVVMGRTAPLFAWPRRRQVQACPWLPQGSTEWWRSYHQTGKIQHTIYCKQYKVHNDEIIYVKLNCFTETYILLCIINDSLKSTILWCM